MMRLRRAFGLAGPASLLAFFLLPAALAQADRTAPPAATWWRPWRGVNVDCTVSDDDLAALAALGVEVVRVNFSKLPLMRKDPPHVLDGEALDRLDEVLRDAGSHGLGVILDPHTFPGTSRNVTIMPRDPFWREPVWHDLAVTLWGALARRLAGVGEVLVAYDLANEPNTPDLAERAAPRSWNVLARRMVAEIRKYDRTRPLLVEPPAGRDRSGHWIDQAEGLAFLDPPDDPFLVYSPHIYAPREFTHQGAVGLELGVDYPGVVDGQFWSIGRLEEVLRPIDEFQACHRAPVFIGEFGASRVSGPAGERYLADLIDLFTTRGWGWCLHAFRSAAIWDPELPPDPSVHRLPGRGRTPLGTPRMRKLGEAMRTPPWLPLAPPWAPGPD
jgi:aryl-phospho-beta-D-glucosidase BglC (GH1 family)